MNRQHEDNITRVYKQGLHDGLDKGRRAMKKECRQADWLSKLIQELPRPAVYKVLREHHELLESIIAEYNPNCD